MWELISLKQANGAPWAPKNVKMSIKLLFLIQIKFFVHKKQT